MKKTMMILGLLVSGAAMAGHQNGGVPGVDATSGYAYGDLRGARDSSPSSAAIGCSLSYNVGIGHTAYCYADNGYGDSGYCLTSDSDFIEVVKMMGSYGYLSFSWDTSDNSCNSIHFFAESAALP